MLQPDFINTKESSITEMICKIDDKLALFGKNKWLNLSFDIDKYYNKEVVGLLIFYKKILLKKYHNFEYANCVKYSDIISRINILLNK